MKIEVWSDFVCPFCYIGKRRLEQALAQFPHKEDVKVTFKSFELDPKAREYSGKNIHEALAEKYGMTIEQAREANEGIGKQAAEAGLEFHFDEMKPTTTFHAHRLAKYAQTVGKEAALTEKLLYAYFTESRLLSDPAELADIAQSAGIERSKAEIIIQDEQEFAEEVRADEEMARRLGVTGVPFFVINQKYAISGAQPLETFINALNQVWEEENPLPKLQDLGTGSDAVCSDGACGIPEKEQ